MLGLGNLPHELDTGFVVGEDDRVENTDLGKGSDLQHSLSDDSNVTLGSHNDVVEIGTVGDTGPEVQLGVSSLGSHTVEVHHNIFDVSVSVLFHSGSTG